MIVGKRYEPSRVSSVENCDVRTLITYEPFVNVSFLMGSVILVDAILLVKSLAHPRLPLMQSLEFPLLRNRIITSSLTLFVDLNFVEVASHDLSILGD